AVEKKILGTLKIEIKQFLTTICEYFYYRVDALFKKIELNYGKNIKRFEVMTRLLYKKYIEHDKILDNHQFKNTNGNIFCKILDQNNSYSSTNLKLAPISEDFENQILNEIDNILKFENKSEIKKILRQIVTEKDAKNQDFIDKSFVNILNKEIRTIDLISEACKNRILQNIRDIIVKHSNSI
ncbi:MAG: hypothetical protein MHPSP_001684, partial [Paramarteilia canceri]